MDKNLLKNFAEENSELQLKLIRDLCAIPAPSHKEENRAKYCKNFLESIGAKGVYIDEAFNCVFPLGCENSNEITVFEAHLDTVFPDLEPYPFKEDETTIYCPGAFDDTACAVNVMLCAKFFIENNLVPEKGILFVCNACEEGLGNLKGTRQLFKTYEGRIKQLITADASLNCIHNSCVGSHRYKVTAKTKGGHSFDDFGNENAINVLSEIITKIYAIDVPKVGNSNTTYNVGVISGGTSINTICQEAEMLCEYRSDTYECIMQMKEKFEKIFESVKNNDRELTVELIGERPCANNVDEEKLQTLIDICVKNIEEITGNPAYFEPASTDCNIPLSLGVPAIAVGSSNGTGVHTREETLNKTTLTTGLTLLLAHATVLGEIEQ